MVEARERVASSLPSGHSSMNNASAAVETGRRGGVGRRYGNRTASCACGQLRVMCAGDPMMVSLCHCLECQKRTGSTYGIAAFFSREAVKTEGDAGPTGGALTAALR